MSIALSFLLSTLMLLLISANGTAFAQTIPHVEKCEQEIVTTETPLSEIVPTCLANRPSLSTPEELITNDLGVCRCIDRSQPLFRPASESPTLEKERQSRVDKIERFNTSLANTRALNVLSHAGNSREAEIGLMTNLGETRRRSRKIISGSQVSEAITELSPEEKARLERGPAISSSITKVNEIEPADSDSQCVTYIEYSAQRELPYDNSFFLFLKSASFREEDWDADRLRIRYDSARADDKPAILARMIFLSRNPQFSAMFRAKPNQTFSRALITQKKNELFSLIKQLAPSDESCASQANGCWRQAQTSGKYQQFTTSSQRFLQSNEVTDIVSAQTASDYSAEFQRIIASTSAEENIPRTPEGYFTYLQSSNRELAFTCSGSQASAQCIDRFGDHCRRITSLHKRIQSGIKRSGNDIQEELNAEMLLHGSMDPKQNMSFDAFNDLMCRRNYQNAAGSEMNFFAYRNSVCSGTNNIPECSDRRALLQRFNTEFSEGGSEADKNIRGGFGVAVTRREFTTVSESQVEAFNRITESPAELRARFGGGYPTINSRGQLVPFTGNSSGANSRTPASSGSGDVSASTDPGPGQPAASDSSSSERTETTSSRQRSRATESDEAQIMRPSEVSNRSAPLPTFPRSLTERNQQLIQQPVIQPQNSPVSQPSSRNREESERSSLPEIQENENSVPAAINQRTQDVSSGGSAIAASSESSAVLSRPVVEVPVRRSGASNTRFNRRALLNGKYADQSKEEVAPSELEEKASVPVAVSPEVLRGLVEDISVLNTNTEILASVNSSSEEVVKLELSSGDDKATVYASRQNGTVSFSLTPPANSMGRSPASLGDNEMNVKLKSDLYRLVSSNPAALNNYPEVVRPAMQLPGDIIRMNIVAPDATPLTIYVDKRGPTLKFTINDQNIIQAYRP